ncbi:MAG: hypothetical protein ACM3Z4_04745 [Hyphomicrobiales bacterium]
MVQALKISEFCCLYWRLRWPIMKSGSAHSDLILQSANYCLLEKALEIEPNYAAAHAPLALCYHARYGRAGLNEQDRAAAIRHAHAAIAGGGDDAIALGIAGFIIALDERDPIAALDLFERALLLSNSDALSLSCSALAFVMDG